jgi:hypothetical protein
MAFPVLAVPVPGSPTFNVDAQLFATGMATFAQAANALGSVIDLSLTSTSTTSLAIGTGSKTLTVQTGLGYVIGYPVRIASVASPSNFMDGIVTAYNIDTGSMTVNVLSVGGSGTIASWNTMVLPGGGNFAGLSNNKFTARQVLADEATIASASTLDFTTGNSNQFVITGTTAVTTVTMDQGAVIKARCTGACPFTHGTNLQIQGGASYTAAIGDIFTFTSNGTVVRVEISKIDGTAVKSTDLETNTSDPTHASTSSTKAASPEWVNGILDDKVFGYGDAWVDLTGTKTQNTTYTNSSNKLRKVMGYLSCTTANNFQVQINGQTMGFDSVPLGGVSTFSFDVPPGATYMVNPGGFNFTVSKWWELG